MVSLTSSILLLVKTAAVRHKRVIGRTNRHSDRFPSLPKWGFGNAGFPRWNGVERHSLLQAARRVAVATASNLCFVEWAALKPHPFATKQSFHRAIALPKPHFGSESKTRGSCPCF